MTRPFRFAVQAGPFGDPQMLAEHARLVESLGYDELYSYDHIVGGPGASGGVMVDPFVPLMVVAAATERLRVGTLVLNNEFHRPALLARTAASVDLMTGGRLVLGMGTGYAENEHAAIGVEIRPPGPRVTRFGESLRIVRELLDTGASNLQGEHEQVSIEHLGVSPAQAHVPILIGGHGRRVVALAGRYADIFQYTGLTHGEGGAPSGGGFALAEVAKRAQWLAESAGDRSDDIERSVLVQMTHVGDDAPSADELSARFELPTDVVEHTPFALFGSLERVVEKLHGLRESIGANHYVVRDPEGFAPVVAALAGQ